ncbi:unnamed protein product [Parascedosporium putredinis]|uniref:Bromo domain-containing protein n=1 Tax=Parascedosporium putredinis TaxID=1442378 RepID=A0A9P1H5W0_9PEZI|nr:unnamed protein product [Parascedosporium putredinis]CAI7999709.1 unnamed protein product [Parascedosporium putredinis]
MHPLSEYSHFEIVFFFRLADKHHQNLDLVSAILRSHPLVTQEKGYNADRLSVPSLLNLVRQLLEEDHRVQSAATGDRVPSATANLVKFNEPPPADEKLIQDAIERIWARSWKRLSDDLIKSVRECDEEGNNLLKQIEELKALEAGTNPVRPATGRNGTSVTSQHPTWATSSPLAAPVPEIVKKGSSPAPSNVAPKREGTPGGRASQPHHPHPLRPLQPLATAGKPDPCQQQLMRQQNPSFHPVAWELNRLSRLLSNGKPRIKVPKTHPFNGHSNQTPRDPYPYLFLVLPPRRPYNHLNQHNRHSQHNQHSQHSQHNPHEMARCDRPCNPDRHTSPCARAPAPGSPSANTPKPVLAPPQVAPHPLALTCPRRYPRSPRPAPLSPTPPLRNRGRTRPFPFLPCRSASATAYSNNRHYSSAESAPVATHSQQPLQRPAGTAQPPTVPPVSTTTAPVPAKAPQTPTPASSAASRPAATRQVPAQPKLETPKPPTLVTPRQPLQDTSVLRNTAIATLQKRLSGIRTSSFSAPQSPKTPQTTTPTLLKTGHSTKWVISSTPSTPGPTDVDIGEAQSPAFEQLTSPIRKPATLQPSTPQPSRKSPRPSSQKLDTTISKPARDRPSRATQIARGNALAATRRSQSVASQADELSIDHGDLNGKVKDEVMTPRMPGSVAPEETGDTTADESVTSKRAVGPSSATRASHKRKRPLDQIGSHRHANMFANPIRERDAPNYSGIVLQPQNIMSIKKAITHGNRIATQTAASLPGGDPGTPVVLLPISEDLVPPKGIINSAQLERELVHMFCNAVMYNPDPDRGPGPGFMKRQQGGDDSLGYQMDEFGVVRSTRDMFVEVEKLLTDLRNAESQRGVPSASAVSLTPRATSTAGVAATGGDETADDMDELAQDDGTSTANAAVRVSNPAWTEIAPLTMPPAKIPAKRSLLALDCLSEGHLAKEFEPVDVDVGVGEDVAAAAAAGSAKYKFAGERQGWR